MIESFIHARMYMFSTMRLINPEVEKLLSQCKTLTAAAVAAAEEAAAVAPSGSSTAQTTPPMLPSPASIGPTSANSTPIGRANGTPSTAGNSSLSNSATHVQPSPQVSNLRPNSASKDAAQLAAASAAAGITVSISASFTQILKEHNKGIAAAKFCMEFSQKWMTLPVMARHFPATFARMVHSTLLYHEEYEPDIEDEEGELFWPGGCATGEGLGWVCLMGKAMILEFGKDFGYKGLEEVVPKPKPEEQGGEGSSPDQGPSQPSAGPTPPGQVSSASSER
jgi:hypothetical protein